MPAISIAAGTIGTYATSISVSITKSGYTPIAAQFAQVGHASGYTPVCMFNNSLAYALLYRASSSAISQPAGDIVVRVLYMKNS